MSPLRATLGAVLIAAACMVGRYASASTLFTLDGLQDVNGDTYSGSFDLTSDGSVNNVAVTVIGASLPDGTLSFSDHSGFADQPDSFCVECNPTYQYDEFELVTIAKSGISYTLFFDVADPLNSSGSNALIPDNDQSDYFSDLDYSIQPPGSDQSTPITVGITQGSLDATTAVPEPATATLFGAGLLLLIGSVALRRARRTPASC